MVLNGLDVDMCNVHVAGTVKMMEAAKEGFAGKIIGVTQLTSTSQQELEKEILVKKTMYETVLAYAEMAAEAGLEGVVLRHHRAPSAIGPSAGRAEPGHPTP